MLSFVLVLYPSALTLTLTLTFALPDADKIRRERSVERLYEAVAAFGNDGASIAADGAAAVATTISSEGVSAVSTVVSSAMSVIAAYLQHSAHLIGVTFAKADTGGEAKRSSGADSECRGWLSWRGCSNAKSFAASHHGVSDGIRNPNFSSRL